MYNQRDSKWKRLLDIPIQCPPEGLFSALDVVWSKVKDNRGVEGDFVAWIEVGRVDDFIKGECQRTSFPTSYYKRWSHSSPIRESTHRVRIDSTISYIIYWCSYGPEDFKEEDALPYDKSKVPTRGTGSRPGRKHIKCGCQCNFNVRILMKRSEYALITYPQMDHVDNNNHICHGQKNHKFEGTRAYYAPHISKELQEWVEKLLLLGMPADIVLQKHREMVHEKLALFDGQTKRDDFLSSHDVQNIDTKIKAAKYMYDRNDAQSVRVWQDQNPNICFEYQEYEGNVEEDGHVPFIMGIQMPQQLEWMLKYGHNNILAMDATFGTNGMKEHWLLRIGMWVRHLRTLKHAGQETNAAIEAYHSILKSKWLSSIRKASHRRVDWLIHQLITVVFIYYWWSQCCKESGFYRNFKVEKLENNQWLHAQSIPDYYVTFHTSDPRLAWVRSQTDDTCHYEVWYQTPHLAMCGCGVSKNGYLCKHVIKVNMMKNNSARENFNVQGLFCAPNVACGDEHVVDDPFGQAWNPPNTCEDSMHVLQQDKHVINEEDEHLSPQVRRIRKIVDNSLVGPLNKSFLTLLENTLVETTNRLRGSQISSILGVQHPEAQPFRPVDDGFNNTLHRERDFIEKMLNRRCPCPTNRKASFPIVKKSRVSRRLTWEDELKRAAERDRERGLVEELEDETNTNGI
ncbi:hypothetical protein KI387_043259 [Taxus chinensis]|uniref:SWIM-type domain-containing protein n=2 Tax=Taxus chinensis TaxID=29808 RepID=A0AA38BZD8_TAXCH|nr:hypothetical protein KI387_043259 [Taxus chinensis]